MKYTDLRFMKFLSKKGLRGLNSEFLTPKKFSKNCHNDTRYCMDNHITIMKPCFNIINPTYFDMIGMLAFTGD